MKKVEPEHYEMQAQAGQRSDTGRLQQRSHLAVLHNRLEVQAWFDDDTPADDSLTYGIGRRRRPWRRGVDR